MIEYLVATLGAGVLKDVDTAGWQPIHRAASRGHLPVVEVVAQLAGRAALQEAVRAGAETKEAQHPIHLAAKAGHLPVVKYLAAQATAGAEL